MITGVAIQIDELWHVMPKPYRHHDIIRRLADAGMPTPISGKQGFIDSELGFVGRQCAAKLALESGQVEGLIAPPNLFSEDLW